MPTLLQLDTFNADSGNLTVFEKVIPGTIKRVFYIYGATDTELSRGGHRHHLSWNALICLHGSCHVYSCDGVREEDFILNNPASCLILEPKDWHIMDTFSKDSILLVLSNEYYDRADYIDEPYLMRSQQLSL